MSQNPKSTNFVSLALVALLFSIFGVVTWLNGTLISFLKTACELNTSQASLVTFAFFISYFVMALPSSVILKKTGFKNGMGLGLVVMAIGCILFIPAANGRSYPLFLLGLFTQGLGLAILQTASNPYVTIIGPIESAATRISIMGVFNKLAGAVGSIVLGSVLLSGMDDIQKSIATAPSMEVKTALLESLTQKIVMPYTILAIALVLVAILIRFSPLPEVGTEEDQNKTALAAPARPLTSYTYLWLGAFAIFVYVGVEVLAGDYILGLGTFLEVPQEQIKYLTSLTLTFMLAGYGLGIVLIPKVISQETALKINAIGALVFVLALMVLKGQIAIFCLAFLGFFHAIMWPAIWPMSIKGLGKHTKTGSALLIMGIAGGAVVPYLYGLMADTLNVQLAFAVMIPCYLFLLFFAFKGHKLGYRNEVILKP